MSPSGASRHVAVAQYFCRFWGEADIQPAALRELNL
jgi:hypothetical protein